MLNRRRLLEQSAALGAAAAMSSALDCNAQEPSHLQLDSEIAPNAQSSGVVLNDRQSQLNATRVRRVVQVRSVKDLQEQITTAETQGLAISVAGGRHAMGGQQFGKDTIHLDTSKLNRVVNFDAKKGIVRAQAGINWLELLDELRTRQDNSVSDWSIRQKQTGVDRVSLAGTLSANAHGRGLQFPPIVADVESLLLVDAAGRAHECSRTENSELFSLAVGGYGLFGVIAEVSLRLVPRLKVKRKVEVIEVGQLLDKIESRIKDGFQFGDCQYATDFSDLERPHEGVLSCYQPVQDNTPMPDNLRELSIEDWTDLILLGHVDKQRFFDTYSQHYLATDGQIYWSDLHQLSGSFDGYHQRLDAKLGSPQKGSEMITELYVKRERLNDFLRAARLAVHDNKIELVYGTIRFIEKDDVSFLAWAKEQSVCVLCNLHVEHTREGIAKASDHARKLIQIAIDHGGRYFPTYHRWASQQQVVAAYPQFVDFLKLKKKYDPEQRFQSEWYRHYRKMFSGQV